MNYIIVDLDDTFLTKDKKVSDYSIDGLKKLREKGFIFVINTARSYLSAKPFIELLKPDYTILNGGTLIYDSNLNIIYQKVIDKNTVNYILNKIKGNVINFSIEGESGLYSSDTSYCDFNPLANYYSFQDEFFEGAYKVLVSDINMDKWISLFKELNLDFEKYLTGTWARISASTKYLGNKVLFKMLKDEKPHDYVFGDDSGDMEMILNAYHGAILINARDELKNKVNNVTSYDNNNDGVIKYMLNIVKQGDF